MEARRLQQISAKPPTETVLNRCLNLTCFLSLILLVCAGLSVYKFINHDQQDMSLFNELKPIFEYYNRNTHELKPIKMLYMGTATQDNKCDQTGAGIILQNLFLWPGTKQGCYSNGQIYAGSCTTSGHPGGDEIPARSSISLQFWKDRKICVKHFEESEYQLRDFSESACPITHSELCGCYCFKGSCPISDWGFYRNTNPPTKKTTWKAETAAWGKWTYGTENEQFMYRLVNDKLLKVNENPEKQEPFALLPQVELNSISCINPEKHPAEPKSAYVLYRVINKGCGQYFIQDPYAVKADENPEWSFYKDNTVAMGTRLQLSGYELSVKSKNINAILINKQQIVRRCSAKCQKFSFSETAPTIISSYNTI